MPDNTATYATIAAAEAAIQAAGYRRDGQRHVWVRDNKIAYVVRTAAGDFKIEWN